MDHLFVISAPEFSLVSFDQSGFPLPLPPALGDLPLYPDDDGFFSVNGPLDLAVFYPPTVLAPVNHDNHSTISRFINEIPGFPGLSSVTKRDRHLCSVDDDVVPSEPRARSERSSYPCNEPGCTWPSPFPTKQALNRHHEVKHLKKHVNCPIAGCERVGDKGIKRKDNLPAHVLNKHGIKLSEQSHQG